MKNYYVNNFQIIAICITTFATLALIIKKPESLPVEFIIGAFIGLLIAILIILCRIFNLLSEMQAENTKDKQ